MKTWRGHLIILTTFWALVGEEDEQDSENDISKEKVDPKEGSKEDTKEMSSNEIKQELTTVIDTYSWNRFRG